MKIRSSGFTILELLMVVGILVILAAIGMENYQSALIRANVARVHSDFRMIETAIESYRLDKNSYPRMADSVFYGDPSYDFIDGEPVRGVLSRSLSSPVAYITTTAIYDPFMSARKEAPLDERLYTYHVHDIYISKEPNSVFGRQRFVIMASGG